MNPYTRWYLLKRKRARLAASAVVIVLGSLFVAGLWDDTGGWDDSNAWVG